MISFPLRSIFIHIPKCAGTSVEEILWPEKGTRTPEKLWNGVFDGMSNPLQTGGLQHLTATHIRGLYPVEFEDFWKFTIVRNPFDRIVSQYFYTLRQRPDLLRYLGYNRLRIRYRRISLDDYVRRITHRTHVQWLPMTFFVTDILRGDIMVDYVARIETLEDDWEVIRARLGVVGDLGRAKSAGERPHYSDLINRSVRTTLEAYYRADLDLFGYSF
jgi:hypothetical protein